MLPPSDEPYVVGIETADGAPTVPVQNFSGGVARLLSRSPKFSGVDRGRLPSAGPFGRLARCPVSAMPIS